MKKLLIIKADTNDADYIHEIIPVEGFVEESLPVIIKVAAAIKEYNAANAYGHNWDVSEYSRNKSPQEIYKGKLTEEEIEIFQEICPHGHDGIHTINSITIYTITNEQQLL